MSKAKTGPQDMPPPGGYAPFQWERVTLRTLFTGKIGVGLFIVVNAIGWPLYAKSFQYARRQFIEKKSNELAALPLLIAENDRATLKYMRRLRDLEADVMKDFPFWEVGTLFGVPIYETVSKDKYREPTPMDMYAFADRFTVPSTNLDPFFT
ncbi:NADH dehydrogenase [ubiquinone] 1 alpha subcomplex subunit 13 [Ceratina calcarata]|uniref:NADH dehydrogenase [ubiquinone] 1 alpha subcomplex subunit 13 n=1 Tax=Ceratina calcarata TaxID=156304 RepID=A0AAJ7NB04_9HYME|nr:NADH dehydrogenase [ubiquinone] 1 alpha subcomplex subunit 13 [Ceratina calcarata]